MSINKMKKNGLFTTVKAYLNKRRLGELMVSAGFITPTELRHALKHQKITGQSLGQILIELNLISRNQLVFTLGRQFVMRSLATCLLFCASLGTSPNKQAHADGIKDIPAEISLVVPAAAYSMYGGLSHYPRLWGTSEKRSSDLKAFTKWRGMFKRFEKDLRSGAGRDLMHTLGDDLERLKGLPIKTMAERVNRLINKTDYITDKRNWGKSDYWATPVEFLDRGGDCEDFAIAKYTALRMLGVPENRVRLVIVHDNLKNIPHAVLVVYTESGAYIMDNQIKTLIDGDNGKR